MTVSLPEISDLLKEYGSIWIIIELIEKTAVVLIAVHRCVSVCVHFIITHSAFLKEGKYTKLNGVLCMYGWCSFMSLMMQRTPMVLSHLRHYVCLRSENLTM